MTASLKRVGILISVKTKQIFLITLIGGLVLFLIVNLNGNSLAQVNKDDGDSNLTFEQQIKNFGDKLTNKTPKEYTQEEAIENGDITPTNITPEQREKINLFMENVNNGDPDFIRFVQFSQTGDPIITEFQFNGELIYYRWDSTRDESGRHIRGNMETGESFKIQEDYCKKLVNNPEMPYITDCYKYESYEF